MKEKESHPIRNGTIASVVGGALLSFWPFFRDVVAKAFLWLWGLVAGVWSYLWSSHEVYGWVIIVLVFLSVPTIISAIKRLKKKEQPCYTELYKEDYLFGAKWHWNYVNGGISNLWCLCPQCESELGYSEFIPDRFRFEDAGKTPRTDFICERCHVPRVSLEGAKSRALGTVEREIRRKIRTNEWQSNQVSN